MNRSGLVRRARAQPRAQENESGGWQGWGSHSEWLDQRSDSEVHTNYPGFLSKCSFCFSRPAWALRV